MRHFLKEQHFLCEQFKTNSSGLKSFYKWCQNRGMLDEDLKTVVRTLKAASLFEKGQSIEAAINSVWDEA